MKRKIKMHETHIPHTVQGYASDTFHQIYRWKLTDTPSWVARFQALSFFLFFISVIPLMILALWNGKSSGSFRIDYREIGLLITALACWPAVLILHELVHGLTMRLFGARPCYGARLKQLLFYATAPGYSFRRNAYIVITLAPLVWLSIPMILGMLVLHGTAWAMLLALCAALNISGSAGDIAITRMVMGHPQQAHIVDEPDGFRVLIQKRIGE